MHDYEQHVGFENSELRDFLSINLLKAYNETNKQHTILSEEKKKIYSGGNKSPLEYAERAVLISQKELEYAIEIHKINKMKLGVLILMNERGWKEHDMGEYLDKPIFPYLNFIGTNEEANDLKSILEKQ